MPRVKSAPRRVAGKNRPSNFRTGRKLLRMRRGPRRIPIVTNTASVRENFSTSLADGALTYFSLALGNAAFNRAQSIAENFQEFRIKYVKLIFKPSADTFPIAAGNTIPQLYFQLNKYQAIPSGASLSQLLDMGCRPVRFDDNNITRAWKPVVLMGADTTTGLSAAQVAAAKVTPWLSTNGFAGNPTAWTASDVEHLGAVWIVTKPNPATPTINYTVDVEVVFQFRRPLSLTSGTPSSAYQTMSGNNVTIVEPPTNSMSS